jgi:transposase
MDHQTLEVLRMCAVEQVRAGVHPEEIAEALALDRKTIYGWLAKFREGGEDCAATHCPSQGRAR